MGRVRRDRARREEIGLEGVNVLGDSFLLRSRDTSCRLIMIPVCISFRAVETVEEQELC